MSPERVEARARGMFSMASLVVGWDYVKVSDFLGNFHGSEPELVHAAASQEEASLTCKNVHDQ